MIDPKKIFSLFDRVHEDTPFTEKAEIAEQLSKVKESPAFKLGMFKKLILNQHLFQKKLINMFKTSNDMLEVDHMEEVGEYMAHHRAWEYIKKCEIDNEIWQDSLSVQNDEHLETAVKLSISFFEDSEEYEKCALLKKIEIFLKNNLEL